MAFGNRQPSRDRLNIAMGNARGLESARPIRREEENDDAGSSRLDLVFGVTLSLIAAGLLVFLGITGADILSTGQRQGIAMSQLTPAPTPSESPLYEGADDKTLAACFRGMPAVRYTPEARFSAREQAISQFSGFLACAMSFERQRFCRASERRTLVTQINRYRSARLQALSEYQLLQEMKRASGKNQSYGLVQGSARLRVSQSFDPTLASQISSLVANGYLSAEDFSGLFSGPPSELQALLATPVTGASCA